MPSWSLNVHSTSICYCTVGIISMKINYFETYIYVPCDLSTISKWNLTMFCHFRSYLLCILASQITTREQAITFEHVLSIWQIMIFRENKSCGIKDKILDNQNSLREMSCLLFLKIFRSLNLIHSLSLTR